MAPDLPQQRRTPHRNDRGDSNAAELQLALAVSLHDSLQPRPPHLPSPHQPRRSRSDEDPELQLVLEMSRADMSNPLPLHDASSVVHLQPPIQPAALEQTGMCNYVQDHAFSGSLLIYSACRVLRMSSGIYILSVFLNNMLPKFVNGDGSFLLC